MRAFMDEDFLLRSAPAMRLYHEYAEGMPIIDYHCHIPPRLIAEDVRFADLADVWLSGDHYKWRIMRANGEPESRVTGGADGFEKFLAYAHALNRAVGNPLYHWSHLELQRYFDCDTPLTPDTARAVWDACNQKLAREPGFTARGFITRSNVRALCTTDDPADDLAWHDQIAQEQARLGTADAFPVRVLPAFRPDKYLNLEAPAYRDGLGAIAAAAGLPAIRCLDDLRAALAARLDYFAARGCVASDHGLLAVPYVCGDRVKKADTLFAAFLSNPSIAITRESADIVRSALLLFLGREYARRGWAMQIHYGAARNVNARMFRALGPDTGYDCISLEESSAALLSLLNALEEEGALPKTILYSLNPNDNAFLAAAAGCFQGEGVRGKIQHGSAWWFNDTKAGMEAQIRQLADVGVLGNFIGMLTDSRSLLSYARHEYFRRVLCNILGGWVDAGELPADIPALGALVRDISYNNAARYFDLG